MYYISSERWDMVRKSPSLSASEITGYGITDTTDNVEEFYSIQQILDLNNSGIKIRGVKGSKIGVYTRKCDIIPRLRSFDVDMTSNEIYINIDIEPNDKLFEFARSIYGSSVVVDKSFGIQVTLVDDCPEFTSYTQEVNGKRFRYHLFYRSDGLNRFLPYNFTNVEMNRLYTIYNEVRTKISKQAESKGIFTLEGYTFEGRIKDEGDYLNCEGYICPKDKFIESMKQGYKEDLQSRKIDREASFREWLNCINGVWIPHNVKLCSDLK